MLRQLERKLGPYAVPHVTLGLILCQVIVYAGSLAKPEVLENVVLDPGRVLQGEVWRVFTFLLAPPLSNPFFAFFFWYLFYLMGTVLEQNWGALRYNVFLLIGYVATVAAAFVSLLWGGGVPVTNGFLQGTVFLAFAYLYPNFELSLFFLLPIKIKWFALVAWIGYFLSFVLGPWPYPLLVAASVLNFFVFFGKDVFWNAKMGRRRMATQAAKLSKSDKPFHRCVVCGITDRTHPDMDFRYCTQCEGSCGYCSEHLHNHEHINAKQDPVRS